MIKQIKCKFQGEHLVYTMPLKTKKKKHVLIVNPQNFFLTNYKFPTQTLDTFHFRFFFLYILNIHIISNKIQ